MRWFLLILVFSAVFSADAAAKNFRWCTVNDDENTKCLEFKTALIGIAKLAGVDITPACVSGSSDEDCMKKIKDDMADFVTLDGGKIYEAGKHFGLVPIVAEDYGPLEGVSYYAVVVARKDTVIDLTNLKGKKSCHTGYRRTAGWNIPMGYLLEKQMPRKGCDAASASAFFSKSCVPGVPKGFPNLCELCPEGSNCASNSQKNKYSGYHGAFKCMGDNKGDVAFVKHLTTGEMVKEGNYGSISDYKYLCTDGTSKVVTAKSHENCNLGGNPSHAVVARPGDNADFVKVLLDASMYCQPNMSAYNCSGFSIFTSTRYGVGKRDLLFKDSTKKLVDVGNRNTYRLWLGQGYTKAIEALGNGTCSSPKPSGSSPKPSGSSPKPSGSPPKPSGATTYNPLPALLLFVLMAINAIV